jgi:hypothetical protein
MQFFLKAACAKTNEFLKDSLTHINGILEVSRHLMKETCDKFLLQQVSEIQ